MANKKLDFTEDRPGVEVTFPDKTTAIIRRRLITGPGYKDWKKQNAELENFRLENLKNPEFDEHEHIRKQIMFMGEGVTDAQLTPLDIMMLSAIVTALSDLVNGETEEAKKNAQGDGLTSSDSAPGAAPQ